MLFTSLLKSVCWKRLNHQLWRQSCNYEYLEVEVYNSLPVDVVDTFQDLLDKHSARSLC